MIGTSKLEYVFIRISIFSLRAVTPLSFLYCIVRPFVRYSLVSLPLDIWAGSEVAFYLLAYLPLRHRCQRPVVHPPPSSRERRRELVQRCLHNISDPERYLSKWFGDASLKEVKRENVKEFFTWAFFNDATRAPEYEEELEEYVKGLEEILERPIEPGRGKAKSLRLTLDEVRMLHRPLIWYLIVFVVDASTHLSLMFHGFQYHRTRRIVPTVFPFRPHSFLASGHSPVKHLSYWYRPHKSKKSLPIVVLHGIGIGLYSYVSFLAALNERKRSAGHDDDVGILAIEILPISFRITHAALPKEEMCRQIQIILAKHGIDKFLVVSHSYGSVITTHLLQIPEVRDRIASVVLVDPVSILLHLPDVAYNFTHRLPQRANEWQLYYFACTDMGVAHTLFRGFFWSDNILWKEDVAGLGLTVFLAGKDQIVNADEVGEYLATASLGDGHEMGDWKSNPSGWVSLDRRWKVVWCAELDHAQVFENQFYRDLLVGEVRRRALEGVDRVGRVDQSVS